MSQPPLPRRRVTASHSVSPHQTAPRPQSRARAADDLESIYLRTLIRAQLRLALACGTGFVAVVAAFSFAIASIDVLTTTLLFGVPWSWILQAYGMYPLVAIFGLLFVRSASRNEKRYRSLRGSE